MSVPGLGSDTSLRVLSLLATAGGLALATRAVARLGGPATGVLAGLVMAASPLLLQQSVEARSYGLAVLATGGAALGPRPLAAGAAARTAAVRARRRRDGAGPLVRRHRARRLRRRRAGAARPPGAAGRPGGGAVAALPVAGSSGSTCSTAPASRNAEHLHDTDGRCRASPSRRGPAGAPRCCASPSGWRSSARCGRGALRVVGPRGCCVPLLLLAGAELLRPVYLPRYLLAGLLGLAVLAAAGALAVPRAGRAPLAALLLAARCSPPQPLARARARGSAPTSSCARWPSVQVAGEPVVAADQRSAIGLDHYVRTLAPRLRADLVLPPDDAPADADRVWLVRRLIDGVPEPTDDDEILRDGRPAHGRRRRRLPRDETRLVLQRWEAAPDAVSGRSAAPSQRPQRLAQPGPARSRPTAPPAGRPARRARSSPAARARPTASTTLGAPPSRTAATTASRTARPIAKKAPASGGRPVSRPRPAGARRR